MHIVNSIFKKHAEGGRTAKPGWCHLRRLALLGVATIIAVLVAEVAVRVLRPQPPSWHAIYRRHPVFPFHALQPNLDVVVWDRRDSGSGTY